MCKSTLAAHATRELTRSRALSLAPLFHSSWWEVEEATSHPSFTASPFCLPSTQPSQDNFTTSGPVVTSSRITAVSARALPARTAHLSGWTLRLRPGAPAPSNRNTQLYTPSGMSLLQIIFMHAHAHYLPRSTESTCSRRQGRSTNVGLKCAVVLVARALKLELQDHSTPSLPA